jgi:hypothetical protein
MRLKAHNSISLLSFIAHELDAYYCSRLTDISYGRGLSKDKIYSVLRDRAQILIDEFSQKFLQVGPEIFQVPSSDGETIYEVNARIAVCSCISGCQGAFCKHQLAVEILYKTNLLNCPLLTA